MVGDSLEALRTEQAPLPGSRTPLLAGTAFTEDEEEMPTPARLFIHTGLEDNQPFITIPLHRVCAQLVRAGAVRAEGSRAI